MTIGSMNSLAGRYSGQRASKDDWPVAYADPIQARKENPKPRIRVKAGSSSPNT